MSFSSCELLFSNYSNTELLMSVGRDLVRTVRISAYGDSYIAAGMLTRGLLQAKKNPLESVLLELVEHRAQIKEAQN